MSIKNKIKYWLPIITAIAFAGGIWLGWSLKKNQELTPEQQQLIDVLNIISEEYVDEVNMDSLVRMSLPQILSNLDPHCAYIPASERAEANMELDGSLSGIGIQFQMLKDTLRVVEIINGGPAQRVGIQAGDKIVEVDGKSLVGSGLTDSQIVSMLRGDKGTHVKLGVKRASSPKTLYFDVTRDDVPIVSIDAAYMAEPNIGYVKVARFGRNTYDEFLNALNRLRLQGATSYIVDLRGNTGGYMETALMMVDEFLGPNRLIVETKGRKAEDNSKVLSSGAGVFGYAGVVVLIDELSASASEIFAGAIQDNDRGLIIGRRSFGKGLVQRQIVLPDSSELRLTVQRYYTPSGRCIQKKYVPGSNYDYEAEVYNRYNSGEAFNADSIKVDESEVYHTVAGRKVYGGGGITPDIFVPNDTSQVTSYYVNVVNAGLIQKYAFEYCDLNRSDLNKCKTVDQVLKNLPSDQQLLSSFVSYAVQNGVPARWYYINISQNLIVNQIKACIVRDILGTSAFFEIYNKDDKSVNEAIKQIKSGRSNPLIN